MAIKKIQIKQDLSIESSLSMYQKKLMSDINLILRLTYDNNTYITKLVEWVDKLIIFEAPISQIDWVIYPTNSLIDVIFVSKLALFHTEIRILRSYRKGSSLFYVGEIAKPLIRKQQRKHFRLDVTLNVLFKVLPQHILPEEMKDNLDTIDLPYEKAICVNISTGGMCLNLAKRLEQGQYLLLNFDFIDHHFAIFGEILDLGDKNAAGYYPHRVKFAYLSDSNYNLLNRLIFEKQRLLLKKS